MKKVQSYFQTISEISDAQVRLDSKRLSAKVVSAMLQVQPMLEISDQGRFKEVLSLLYLSFSHDYFRMEDRYDPSVKNKTETKLFALVPPDDVLIKGTRNIFDLFTDFDLNFEYVYALEDYLDNCGKELILFAYRNYLRNLTVSAIGSKQNVDRNRAEYIKKNYYALCQQIKRSYSLVKCSTSLDGIEVNGRVFELDYEYPVEWALRHTVSNVENDCRYLPDVQSNELDGLCFGIEKRAFGIDSVVSGTVKHKVCSSILRLDITQESFSVLHLRGVMIIFSKGTYDNSNSMIKGRCFVMRYDHEFFNVLRDTSSLYSRGCGVYFQFAELPTENRHPEGMKHYVDNLPSSEFFRIAKSVNNHVAGSEYYTSVYALCEKIMEQAKHPAVLEGGEDA